MTHFEVETKYGSYPACNPYLPANVLTTTDEGKVDCKSCKRTKAYKARALGMVNHHPTRRGATTSLTKASEIKCGTVPCPTCPWRKSSKVGGFEIPGFNIAHMRRLRRTVGEGDDFRPIMACHHSREGADAPCVGYVAVEGYSNINVRLLTSRGVIDQPAIDDACAGIEMWDSLASMLAAYEAALAAGGKLA